MYRLLFHHVLSRFDAETVHHSMFFALRTVAGIPGVATLGRKFLGPRDKSLRTNVFGKTLPGPLGLAAGFDKDAKGIDALAAVGFAFVEVGTITAQPQPGNPKPRLFRLPADRCILNRMGFNNQGSQAAATRLQQRRQRAHQNILVGANIGKTKVVSETDAVADYVASATALAPLCDYLVVNVSSPNTPGLRDLQSVAKLRPLLGAVKDVADTVARQPVPVLVKIAPDLADDDVLAVADLVLDLNLAGVVATNTTISRDNLSTTQNEVEALGAGGISGPVLAERSLAVLRMVRDRLGPEPVIISVGGIWSGTDAYERLAAGATLIQGYTAFIYQGLFWPRRVHRQLARLLRTKPLTLTKGMMK